MDLLRYCGPNMCCLHIGVNIRLTNRRSRIVVSFVLPRCESLKNCPSHKTVREWRYCDLSAGFHWMKDWTVSHVKTKQRRWLNKWVARQDTEPKRVGHRTAEHWRHEEGKLVAHGVSSWKCLLLATWIFKVQSLRQMIFQHKSLVLHGQHVCDFFWSWGLFFLFSVSPNSGPAVDVWSFTETRQKEWNFGAAARGSDVRAASVMW